MNHGGCISCKSKRCNGCCYSPVRSSGKRYDWKRPDNNESHKRGK